MVVVVVVRFGGRIRRSGRVVYTTGTAALGGNIGVYIVGRTHASRLFFCENRFLFRSNTNIDDGLTENRKKNDRRRRVNNKPSLPVRHESRGPRCEQPKKFLFL